MEAFLYVLGFAAIALGIAGLFLPALPGTALIFAGIVLVAWAGGFQRIGIGTLVVVAFLAAAAIAADYLAGVLGAKRFGASKWGILGAFAGMLLGLPFGFLGIVFGPAVGAVALEYLRDREFQRATRAGFGTFVGLFVGLVVKSALAFMMIGIAAVAWLWGGPGGPR